MSTCTTPSGRGANLHAKSASLLLCLLLIADIAFIAIHSINYLFPFLENPLLSLEQDGGYPELYESVKWFWISLLFVYLAVHRRSLSYCSWGLLFIYLLFDDALGIHENIGALIAGRLSITPPLGLRLQDLGELAVSGTAGLVFFSLILWAYISGPRTFRKMTHDMLLLTAALAFFGAFVDMAHEAIQMEWELEAVMVVIEDGGEMAVASFMLWYAFLTSIRDENAAVYLIDSARTALKKHAPERR